MAQREQELLGQMVSSYQLLSGALRQQAWDRVWELQSELEATGDELTDVGRALGPLAERETRWPELRELWGRTREMAEVAVKLSAKVQEWAREASLAVKWKLIELSRNRERLVKYRPVRWHRAAARFTSCSA